jgi:hypothetical protein
MSVSANADDLDAVVKPLGFTRRKMTWNRRSGEFIDVIDLQRGKSGDMVTMNVGVIHIAVHRRVWGKDVPAFAPKIHLAMLRFERGDKSAACALLSEMTLEVGKAWLDKIDEISKRIDCG